MHFPFFLSSLALLSLATASVIPPQPPADIQSLDTALPQTSTQLGITVISDHLPTIDDQSGNHLFRRAATRKGCQVPDRKWEEAIMKRCPGKEAYCAKKECEQVKKKDPKKMCKCWIRDRFPGGLEPILPKKGN